MYSPIWITRTGQRLPISQLDDDHLANCIAKIERSRRGWRREYLERLKLEQEIRSIARRASK